MEYLRRLRIELARELLADPSLSIKEVAARTGFTEPNHFSRVFSRIDGVPPTAFREALLIGKASRQS
jgi:two-component system response regulator YesN